eukprot:TRINITY_DN22249_c0_g1_i1.p1 TRINITY_DN22249_c0_g1~~TRINITY_DN22249_c0_g1_i1.p1  ORF type:complete len:430 (+),score=72.90 TRINITY_DN22249_c0_g1_i1:65-1291(+)
MDDYEVGDVLGKGSYGCAKLCVRKKDGAEVVIKVLPNLKPKDMLNALKEIHILGSLGHPNIIRYYSSFEAQSCVQIVTEYADSGDLAGLISNRRKEGGHGTTELGFNIMIQTLMALRHLHGKRILHRDLKPANIFLTKKTIVKVGDFGVSTVLQSNTNLANTFCGTLHYLSPEVCEDKPYNNKADVWAVGCCIYELISLKRAFDSKAMLALANKIINGEPDSLPDSTDEGLKTVIELMLTKSATLRPNASKLLGDAILRDAVCHLSKELFVEDEYTMFYGKEIAKVLGLKRSTDYQKDLAEMEAWAAKDILKLEEQEQNVALSILKMGSASPSPVPTPRSSSSKSNQAPPPLANHDHRQLADDVSKLLAAKEAELNSRHQSPSFDEPSRDTAEDFTDTVCIYTPLRPR